MPAQFLCLPAGAVGHVHLWFVSKSWFLATEEGQRAEGPVLDRLLDPCFTCFVAINCLSSIAIVWFLSWCVLSFIGGLCCKPAACSSRGACCLLRYFCGLSLTQFLQRLNCPFQKGTFLAFVSILSVAGIMWLIPQMRVVTLKQTHTPALVPMLSVLLGFFFSPCK